MIKHVPYKGDPLPDDIVRIILKRAAEKGIVAREVCKAWLNVSNSLIPFFLNTMKSIQNENRMMRAQLDHLRDTIEAEGEDFAWACKVSTMRMVGKCRKETLVMLCNDFDIPASGTKERLADDLGEQLHYETDNGTDESDIDDAA